MLSLVDAGLPGKLAFAEDGRRAPAVGPEECCRFMSLNRDDLRRDDPVSSVRSFAAEFGGLGNGGARLAVPAGARAASAPGLGSCGELVVEDEAEWLFHSAALRDMAVLAMVAGDPAAAATREGTAAALGNLVVCRGGGESVAVYLGSRGLPSVPFAAPPLPACEGLDGWMEARGAPFASVRPYGLEEGVGQRREWLSENAAAIMDDYLAAYLRACSAPPTSLLSALQQSFAWMVSRERVSFCRVCSGAAVRRGSSAKRFDSFACTQWLTRNAGRAAAVLAERMGVTEEEAASMLA